MKILISPETEEEKETFGGEKLFENIFEFGLIGRYIAGSIYEKSFSHLHIVDRHCLIGKLHELLSRMGSDDTLKR